MTDPELTPAEGDTPGPFATPAQDADVRALLGTLRAEDVPMPDDVVRRINAAVVAERVASTLPDSPAALVDAEDGTGGTLTVLPTAQERRGPSYRRFSTILAAAAAVVVVVGVGALITKSGGLSSTSSGAASSAAPESAGGGQAPGTTKVSDSGSRYAASTLADQAARLVREPAPVVTPQPSASDLDAEPVGSPTRGTAYLAMEPDVLDRCVQLVTSTPDPPAPVAVDAGTYEGKAALVLVLPSEDDPASLDVYVVAPTCGTGGEPPLYQFQRIARP